MNATPAGNASFTVAFAVDQTPGETLQAINNVRGWRPKDIETQSLRMLLAGQGVRVHAVLIGSADTDMARVVPAKLTLWARLLDLAWSDQRAGIIAPQGLGMVSMAAHSLGAANAKAKRELCWTPHYLSWHHGFTASYSQPHPQRGASAPLMRKAPEACSWWHPSAMPGHLPTRHGGTLARPFREYGWRCAGRRTSGCRRAGSVTCPAAPLMRHHDGALLAIGR